MNLHIKTLSEHSAFRRRLKSRKRTIRTFEEEAAASRTFGERVADFLTSRLGSMKFLVLNALWFFGWIAINTGNIPGIQPFDPYPFGLLTTAVSLEAIFLAIIVLISQNRAERIDDLRAETDLHINTITEEEVTKIMELQILLLKKNGIDVSHDEELKEMLEPTDPRKKDIPAVEENFKT